MTSAIVKICDRRVNKHAIKSKVKNLFVKKR